MGSRFARDIDSFVRTALLFVATAAVAGLGSGCTAMPRPQAGYGALRVEVKAQPKAGFRDAGGGAAYGDDGQPLVRPGYERIDYRNLSDIVVWLEPSDAATQPVDDDPLRVTVNLSAALRADVPPVIAVGRSATLTVVNDTKVAEDVFSVTRPNNFDLGSVAAGNAGDVTFNEPGTFDLLIGSREMPAATVFVAPTRWVQSVRSGGAAAFTDVPPGRCTVSAWHPRFPLATSTVDVVVGESRSLVLRVGVNELPK